MNRYHNLRPATCSRDPAGSREQVAGRRYIKGFTLIEILIALAVIAIAVSALLIAITQSTSYASRVEEKIISHWVAMNAVRSIQLGIVTFESGNKTSKATTFLGQKWYWRAELSQALLPKQEKIIIFASNKANGKFLPVLEAYRNHNE